MRLVTALALSGALLISSVAAVDAASAGTGNGTQAVAAKKKKKKKKNPLFKQLAGRSLNRVIQNSPPTPVGTERWDFCRNSTYLYTKTDYAYSPQVDGPVAYTTSYNGSWRIASSVGGSQGVIGYSVGNFTSVNGLGGPGPDTSPPSSSAAPILLMPFGVNFGGAQYTFGGGSC